MQPDLIRIVRAYKTREVFEDFASLEVSGFYTYIKRV